MTKLKNPLLSLEARGKLAKLFAFKKKDKTHIVESIPTPTDTKSSAQLFNRHMFTKCINLWQLLSKAEQQHWESLARPRHMTGYAWFISQCLRPNPGIYLPLQGGTMQGNIDIDSHRLLNLLDPTLHQEPVTLKYFEDNLPAGGYTEGARVYHTAQQAILTTTLTFLAFNSERYDTNNIHNTVTNNSRLTCKTPGKYAITGHVYWTETFSYVITLCIILNGATYIAYLTTDPTVSSSPGYSIATIWHLALNDFIELAVYQNSGASRVIGATEALSPEFAMQRIG